MTFPFSFEMCCSTVMLRQFKDCCLAEWGKCLPQNCSPFGCDLLFYRCQSGAFIPLLISNYSLFFFFFLPLFSRLSWLENSGVGFSLDYPTISLHAVSRDLNAYPWEHLYVMVNARFEGKPHNPFLSKGINVGF